MYQVWKSKYAKIGIWSLGKFLLGSATSFDNKFSSGILKIFSTFALW